MKLRSIRSRIQIWYGLILLVLSGGVVAAFSVIEYRGRIVQVDADIKQLMTASMPHVRSKDKRPRPAGRGLNWGMQMEVRDGLLILDDSAFFLLGWERYEELILSTNNLPEILVPYAEDTSVGNDFEAMTLHGYRVVRINDRYHRDSLLMWAGYDLSALHAAMRPFILKASGVALIAWVVVMAAGWWIVGYGLRLIDSIRSSAERIEGGAFHERIDIKETQNELSALAIYLNRSFDRLEAAYRQQVLFTAEATHELRTPLTVVLSRAQLVLREEGDAASYREALQDCVDSTKHMAGLVEGLQAIAQMDAEVEDLDKQPADLLELADDMVELMGALAAEASITLVKELQSCPCEFDISKMQQVLMNLIGNAIKYGRPEDRVMIRTYQKGNCAFIEVEDTGVGISAEDLPYIFDRFYRVDKTRMTQERATGLGLTICRNIVEAHGGAVEVSSQVDEGTRFTVRLPEHS